MIRNELNMSLKELQKDKEINKLKKLKYGEAVCVPKS